METETVETTRYPRIECYRCGYKECFDQEGYEFGVHYYYRVISDTGEVVCDDCEDYGIYEPNKCICWHCKMLFDSRNKLFQHLKDSDHYIW